MHTVKSNQLQSKTTSSYVLLQNEVIANTHKLSGESINSVWEYHMVCHRYKDSIFNTWLVLPSWVHIDNRVIITMTQHMFSSVCNKSNYLSEGCCESAFSGGEWGQVFYTATFRLWASSLDLKRNSSTAITSATTRQPTSM